MKINFWKALGNRRKIEDAYDTGRDALRDVRDEFRAARSDGQLTLDEAVSLVASARVAIEVCDEQLAEIERLVSK